MRRSGEPFFGPRDDSATELRTKAAIPFLQKTKKATLIPLRSRAHNKSSSARLVGGSLAKLAGDEARDELVSSAAQ